MDQDNKQELLRDLKEFKAHKGWKIWGDLSDKLLEHKNKELQTQLRQHNLDKAFALQAFIDGFIYREVVLEDYVKKLIVPEEETPAY